MAHAVEAQPGAHLAQHETVGERRREPDRLTALRGVAGGERLGGAPRRGAGDAAAVPRTIAFSTADWSFSQTRGTAKKIVGRTSRSASDTRSSAATK